MFLGAKELKKNNSIALEFHLTLWLPRTFLYCFKCNALRLMFYIILYNKINLMATWSTGHPGS